MVKGTKVPTVIPVLSGQEKKGFSFKFEIPSSGGAGGGSKPGGENQEELLKKAGMALVVVAGMYYLHVQV